MQQYQQETIELGNKRNQARLLEQIDDLNIQQQQQLLINILHFPYQERKSEILQMLRHIMQKVDLLQQFHTSSTDNEAYDYCLKHLTIDNYTKNTVIFEKGEYANNIYIVIKGQVALYSNDHLVDQTKSRKHSFSVDYGRDSQHNNRVKYSDFKIKSLIRLCEFKEWKTFGEQAIIEERLRTNIAVCDQDSTLAIINKESYLNAVSIMERKIELNKMNNFKLNPSFHGLSKKLINLLLFTFQSHDYKFRDIIYKKGQLDSDTFYIIKSGEFLVYTVECQIIRKQIAIMTSGEMFGDFEAFEKIPRQFNVQCNSHHGSLIMIPLQILMQKLSQFNEQNHLQQLRNLSVNKNKLYQEFKTSIDQAQGKFQQFLKVQEISRNTTISCSSQRIDSQIKEEAKQVTLEPPPQANPITELKNSLNFLTQVEEVPMSTDQGEQKIKNQILILPSSPEKLQPLPKIKLITNKKQDRTGLSTPERFGQIIEDKMNILKKIHNLSPERKVNLKTLQYKTIHVQMPKQVKMELKIEKQWPINVQLYLNDLDDRMRHHNTQTFRYNQSCQERSVDQSTFSKYEEEYNTERAGKMQVLNNILQQSVTKRGKQRKRRALTLKYREYLESQFPQKSQISLLFS